MFDSEQKLRHLPFFEELATKDEGEATWRAAMAGLVTLRLVDSWLDDGPAITADDSWSLRSVLSAIEDIEDGSPVRALLTSVAASLLQQRPDIHVVVTPLMAYARTLEYDARWLLATDVYQTVLAHLHPTEDSDASIAAHLRLGQCYRTLGRLDDAVGAYASAGKIASAVDDMVGVLRARMGEGNIAMLRGNLPEAEQILDETISRATGTSLRDVRGRAMHERANLPHSRGQYELAIRFAYEALEHSGLAADRDRILGDIAVSFLELGVYTAARDAYLVLSATAQEQYTRWGATLNLLEIASRTGAEPLFELYRRQLSSRDLPPYMATAFALATGFGYQRFGNRARARAHFEGALQIAGAHGYNQYLFEAEGALSTLDAPTPPQQVSAKVSLELEEVAGALQGMRESAGVS
ncbi:MAG: hypothetical protein WD801_15670 [Gemmatimonadaceae bacterium]